MIVAKDGSGDFSNLQEAIDSISDNNLEEVIIYIKNGLYKQKINITKSFVTLIGEDAENTIITFDDSANKLLPNSERMRTFNSYTVYISGDNFRAENITFENSAGSGDLVGQAIAVYAEGDRLKFTNCRMIGCQDTLFTAPLPLKPIEGKGFGGPGEKNPRRNVRQYYERCYIKGDVDFIFGSATAVFNKCEIFSNDRKKSINGFITAASTPVENEFGYVFIDCRLTGEAAPHTVYLGRPWRDHAKTAFINCWMGEHIIPSGWHDWDKKYAAENLVEYVEYRSKGPGSAPMKRVKWSRILIDEEAEKYSISNILSGSDNWIPYSAE